MPLKPRSASPGCVTLGEAFPSLVVTHILDRNISMGTPVQRGQADMLFGALGPAESSAPRDADRAGREAGSSRHTADRS